MVILFLFFLILILVACRTDTIDELSDLDISQILELNLELEGRNISFVDLESGYYYFVSNNCSACLDEDLAKVEGFNLSSSSKIYVITSNNETIGRVSHYLNNTKIYKAHTELSQWNFMLEKIDNEFYFVDLEELTN